MLTPWASVFLLTIFYYSVVTSTDAPSVMPPALEDALTPLMKAVSEGNNDQIKSLTAAAADTSAFVNEATGRGTTALLVAIQMGRQDLFTLLLDLGASVDSVSADRHGPLMMASAIGQYGMVVLLLKRGAAVNASDEKKLTPLMYACASKRELLQVVLRLLEAHADVNKSNMHGKRGVWYFFSRSFDSCIYKRLLSSPTSLNVQVGRL